jgi:hypothetical protein
MRGGWRKKGLAKSRKGREGIQRFWNEGAGSKETFWLRAYPERSGSEVGRKDCRQKFRREPFSSFDNYTLPNFWRI